MNRAILISIKPPHMANICNGDKTVEVRTSKALANATKKMIEEQGYARFLAYCSKDNKNILFYQCADYGDDGDEYYDVAPLKELSIDKEDILNGKVVCSFKCYKVEEILPFEEYESPFGMAYKLTKDKIVCCYKAQLTYDEYNHYLKGKKGCAIHISDLEIFDEPKELSEFKSYKKNIVNTKINGMVFETELDNSLIKAPQNMVYVEIPNDK